METWRDRAVKDAVTGQAGTDDEKPCLFILQCFAALSAVLGSALELFLEQSIRLHPNANQPFVKMPR